MLQYDEPLSTFAFIFNSRHYNLGMHVDPPGGPTDLGGMTLRALGLVSGDMPVADDPKFHGRNVIGNKRSTHGESTNRVHAPVQRSYSM